MTVWPRAVANTGLCHKKTRKDRKKTGKRQGKDTGMTRNDNLGGNMKKLIEVSDEGFEGLMGEVITCFCVNYFYTGKLVGVNSDYVKLENPSIVYETGAWNESDWKDAQSLPNDIYVRVAAIESFGVMK